MDDNNTNREQDNIGSPDTESEITENESDYERFMNAQQNGGEDEVRTGYDEAQGDYVSGSESEETAIQADDKKKGRTKIGNGVLISLSILLIIATAVMAIYLIKNRNGSGGNGIDMDRVVLTVNGVDSTAGEFAYWYSTTNDYYYYYQLSEDQLREITIEQLSSVNALYGKAKEAGLEISEDEQKEIDGFIAEYKKSAESASMSIDEFMAQDYGSNFRFIFEKYILAMKYANSELTKISDKYSGAGGDAKIEAEYSTNKKNYDVIDTSYYYFDASLDDSESNANAVISAVESGKTFDDAVRSVVGDGAKPVMPFKGYEYESVKGSFGEDVADWIFAVNENGEYSTAAGSIKRFDINGAIYLVYINNIPSKDETYPVVVNYIAVKIDSDDKVKSEEELLIAAKSKANEILEEFKKGTADEQSFSAIAEAYKDSKITSGVYDSDAEDGFSSAVIDEWAFEADRKTGDTALLVGDGVCYVVFYSSKDEKPVWYQNVRNILLNAAQKEWQEELVSSYENNVEKNDEIITEIIEYVNKKAGISAN